MEKVILIRKCIVGCCNEKNEQKKPLEQGCFCSFFCFWVLEGFEALRSKGLKRFFLILIDIETTQGVGNDVEP